MLFRKRSWTALAALFMAASFVISIAMAQSKGKTETLTGTVSDAMCGAKHTMMKNGTDKDCTLACVKMGSKYALVVGDKVYELDGKESDLQKFAGAKAKVTGTVDGTKMHVSAVAAP